MPVQREYTISGKQLLFKERIPLRDGHKLKAWVRDTTSKDYSDDIPALMMAVDPCELIAEPAKRAAWDDLDLFGEIVPAVNALARYIVERIGAAWEIEKN